MSPDLTRIDHRHHFVADTHFGHVGILDMAMRPYPDIRAHDRDLVDQWNALVQKTDTVWHLGDFAGEDVPFDRAADIFGKLNGTIHLIRGNHDSDEVCSKLPWASVDVLRTLIGSDGRKVVLCHYPLREWEGYHAGNIHFHGHTHDRLPSSRRSWDCGVRPPVVSTDDLRRHRRAHERAAGRRVAARTLKQVGRQSTHDRGSQGR